MTEAHTADNHMRNAFFFADLVLDEMVKLHAMVAALEDVAVGKSTFFEEDAIAVSNSLEAILFGFGALRSCLTELRICIPEEQS